MVRWMPDSRGRLVEAAQALYSERGFEETTVAAIATRAGLTERTFFRYFADKREVLFWGSNVLQKLLVGAVDDAPAGAAPLDAIAAAFEAAATAIFRDRREYSRQRQAIIAADVALQERELSKLATLAAALTDALRRRGLGDPAASLAAEAGVVIFKIAVARWVEEDEQRDLPYLIHDSLATFRAVTARN